MKGKKTIKRILWLILSLILLINTIAFFHAYKFTHFNPSISNKTKDAHHLSLTQKIGIILFGVDNPRPQTKARPAVPFQVIKLKSNKTIEYWLIKNDIAKGTVILFHGYGGEKSSMLDKAAIFRALGYNTMLVDFMGAGGSEGNQTTVGFKEAEEVKTCIDFLKSTGESNTILFGTSLGATAVMKALNDYNLKVSSVIIECPFSTLLKTVINRFETLHVPSFPMANLLVFWGGVQNGFNAFSHNPVDFAKNIHCPVLLMYGQKDEKVSPEETEAIFKNLSGPKKLVTFPLAAHENYLTKYRKEWTKQVEIFLKQKP